MEMAPAQVSLSVGGNPVELQRFVWGFIEHTVCGMVSALEGIADIQEVYLSVDGDAVHVKVNDEQVPVNLFVSKIIANSVRGMVSPLKGVGETGNVLINITR